MRVLVLGSGGREHALCWAIARSPRVDTVLCAPGSDGIGAGARVLPADLADVRGVVDLAKREGVDLVVVGPEDPLVHGVADALVEAGIAVFGPGAAAARLEGSKAWAKAFMLRHGIPTARAEVFVDPDAAERHVRALGGPIVVKADGLASGKGVAVCDGPEPALEAIRELMRERRFGAAGERVLLEEKLEGEELSFYAICDGERALALGSARDHKRALDGDRGENTGGMGAFSPVPGVDAGLERKILDRIVRPTLAGMRAEGHPYRGVLFCGLMIRDGEPRVIEFNVRFGDPETQPLLLRLESDLVPLLEQAARGRLPSSGADLRLGDPALCVVLASAGYPRASSARREIHGLEAAERVEGVTVFHSGTLREDGRWWTRGGRVLGVCARAPDLAAARARAYSAIERIRFEGMQYRRDIAAGAPQRS